MSSTRARFASDSTSCSSARRRRRSCRRTPATSSNSGRRSSGRRASAWSTMPWPMNRKAFSARCPASSRSTRSFSRTRCRFSRYSFSPDRYSRRPSSTTPNSTGSRPSALSRVSWTSAMPTAGPLLRAGPDDVLGLARAQRPALLAERPAERVGEVALARAVGPDDGADPGPELDVRPLGERLEALEPHREEARRRGHPATSAARFGRAGQEDLDGLCGRGGLGHPARRSDAHPEHLVADGDLDPEDLVVVGPDRLDDPVRGPAAGRLLGRLLEPALGALEQRRRRGPRRAPAPRSRGSSPAVRSQPTSSRRAPASASNPDARIDGRVGPTRAASPSPSARKRAEIDPGGQGGEPGRAHDRGAARGQDAFVVIGMARIEGLRDGKVDHRVAEVLESLVVPGCLAGVLVEPRAVGQRLGQEAPIRDREAELLGEEVGPVHDPGWFAQGRGIGRASCCARRCIRRRRRRCGSARRPRRRSRCRTLPRGS